MNIFQIDRNNLDVELENQSENYHKVAVHLAMMKYKVYKAKAKLDLTKAEVSKRIRENPEDYRIKITEGTIETILTLNKVYQKALRMYNRARHQMDIAEAAVDALDIKKESLKEWCTSTIKTTHKQIWINRK